MTDELFVYGTLLPGQVRWIHLQPFVDGEGAVDTIGGTLFDTGVGYPAFVGAGDGRVHGMRFRLAPDTKKEALEVLDAIEGAVAGLYRRITVTTGDGVEVFVYEYGRGLDLEPIPGGNWLSR